MNTPPIPPDAPAGLTALPKETDAELRRLNRALRAISECNQALVRATDEAALLWEVCRTICAVGGYRLAWVGYAENDAAQSVRATGQYGEDDGYLTEVQMRVTLRPSPPRR